MVVFDQIIDILETIPTNSATILYLHLRYIDFPRVGSREVILLLGYDTHKAFRLTEQRYGEYGQPFRMKIMLKWNILGGNASLIVTRLFI